MERVFSSPRGWYAASLAGSWKNQLIGSLLIAGALNFRDVMLAYGKLSKQQMAHESGGDNIGFEFSGTIVSPPSHPSGSLKLHVLAACHDVLVPRTPCKVDITHT